MDLTPYVSDLRNQVAAAADTGDDDVRRLAERLTAALDAATRLVLFEALAAAAAEITTDLAPGSVEVRLRGRDPEFVVTAPPADDVIDDVTDDVTDVGDRTVARQFSASVLAGPVDAPPAAAGDTADGGSARITLRLPDQLKVRIEEVAGRDGLSVNAWLVRAVAAAVEPAVPARRAPGRSASAGQRYTGWSR